ncbi:ATP-dependent helicase wrn-1-like [Clytia hemisphaerica]|uniref:ATP-dependent helicase wrn-1-like n=1 Tax=Clytia hemisphaerica TaxID=252671 RepID=UPI0034D4CEBB
MANANFIANAVEDSLSQIDKNYIVRPKQLEAIINILKGKDTLAILPTSYGKSLIFRLIPSVCKQLRGHTNNAIVAVIAPLESIIKDQIDAANKLFSSLGTRACRVDSSSANVKSIQEEGYNILIGTPESWLESDAKDLLSSTHFQKHLKCIVIDEAHLVSWGHGDASDEEPFRETFGKINELRSFACESVPILCLSATFIGIYHASSWPHKKNEYLKSLTSNDGEKRVIICSSALGCGVDCQDVKFVLHFGPPHNLVDYAQQIGRAGRSNAPDCHAVLYSFPQAAKIANDVKSYIDHTGCLRKKLFSPFSESDTEISPVQPGHDCCNICAQDCHCESKTCKQSYFEVTLSDEDKPVKVRNVTDKDCETIQSRLFNLHEKITKSSNAMFVPSGIISGLTNEIIFQVVRHLKFINSAEYITTNLSIVSESLAKDIFDIIASHFSNTALPCEPKSKPIVKNVEKQFEFGDFEFDSDFSLEEDYGVLED